jgi:hypothetical protein
VFFYFFSFRRRRIWFYRVLIRGREGCLRCRVRCWRWNFCWVRRDDLCGWHCRICSWHRVIWIRFRSRGWWSCCGWGIFGVGRFNGRLCRDRGRYRSFIFGSGGRRCSRRGLIVAERMLWWGRFDRVDWSRGIVSRVVVFYLCGWTWWWLCYFMKINIMIIIDIISWIDERR